MVSRKTVGIMVLVAGLVLLVVPGPAQAQFVLYDDFNAPGLDPSKWWASDQQAGPLAPSLETVRLNGGGTLWIELASYGDTASNTGIYGPGRQRMRFQGAAAITGIQAEVTVVKNVAEDCAANATSTRARAQLLGFFFNDGTSPAPGDPTGDIGAGIHKVRDSKLGHRIDAFFVRCPDSACIFGTTLGAFTFATSWTEVQVHTLRVQWDPSNNRFLFAVGTCTGPQGGQCTTTVEETAALTYALPDAIPATLSFVKELRVDNTVANCTAGRRGALMQAVFDNAMINTSLPAGPAAGKSGPAGGKRSRSH